MAAHHSGGPPKMFMWGQPPSAVRPSVARLVFVCQLYWPAITRTGAALATTGSPRTAGPPSMRNSLARFRRTQSDPPRNHINALRIAQGGVLQPQGPIHLGQAADLTLRRFDLITVLNGLEMLPGIRKNQQEQAHQRRTKLLHFPVAPRIFHLHQPRVVDRFGEVDFRRTRP